jgi:TfoX/Sxy family transcriptional regulator of competence genes
MAYDEKLAERVRRRLYRRPAYAERRMFGGICFTLRGHMCCGVLNDELIVRVAPGEHAQALARPQVRAFDFTGRPMKGFVVVRPKGCATAQALAAWIARGIKVAAALPAKPRKRPARPRRTTR